VNLLLSFVLTDWLGVHYLLAAVLATQGSTLWNFALTEGWVFADRLQRWNRPYRLIMFLLMNNAALTLRGPIMFTLTSGLGIHYLFSNLLSLIAFTVLRYTLADALIWRDPNASEVSNFAPQVTLPM
jgi:dolichol-phosphate mannosyltransferase